MAQSKSDVIRRPTIDDMMPWNEVPEGFKKRFREFYWSGLRGRDAQGKLVIVKGSFGPQPAQQWAKFSFYLRGQKGQVRIPWRNPQFTNGIWNINNYPNGEPSLELDGSNPSNIIYRFRIRQALIEYALDDIGAPLWYSVNRNAQADLMQWSARAWIGGFDSPRGVKGRLRTAEGEINFEGVGLFEHAVSADDITVEEEYRDSRWMWFGDKNFYGIVLESRDRRGVPLIKTGRFGRIDSSAERLDNYLMNVPMVAGPYTIYHLEKGELWNADGNVVTGQVAFDPIKDLKPMGGRQGAALMTGEISDNLSAKFNGIAWIERQLQGAPYDWLIPLMVGAPISFGLVLGSTS